MIAGRRFWLWRAVDDEGEVLDLLVQRRRDKAAAVKLMRKLLRKQGFAPDVLVTDKLRSYWRGKVPNGIVGLPSRVARKQSGREFASADTTARAQDAPPRPEHELGLPNCAGPKSVRVTGPPTRVWFGNVGTAASKCRTRSGAMPTSELENCTRTTKRTLSKARRRRWRRSTNGRTASQSMWRVRGLSKVPTKPPAALSPRRNEP